MARLPQVGGDTGNWGTILNDFLSVAHNPDGTSKDVIINVKSFGAKGDGTTDDTAAIQAAINSIPTDSAGYSLYTDIRGKKVFIPAGRYRVTGQITLKAGVSLLGDGQQSSLLINEGATNHVLYFLGNEGGIIVPLVIEDLGVVQKSGVPHSTGSAIYIDGGGFGCTVSISRVSTYATAYGLRLRDVYLSKIERVEAYAHINGFYTDTLCTSLNFEACYAGSCTGSGYKIFGHYMAFTGCGSDNNALDGYEVYYNGGSATSIVFNGCGSERFGRNGISCDRGIGVAINAPRMIAKSGSGSAVKLMGGIQYTIVSPVLSALTANTNPAIDISNSSGAYPVGVCVISMTQAANYASFVNNTDRVFLISDQTVMGLGAKGLRLGGLTNFDENRQSLFVNMTPAGSNGLAYGASFRPIANAAHTIFAAAHINPMINAPSLTVARSIGQYVVSPTVTAGTVSRAEGVRIEDIAGGSTGNANLAFGSSAIAAGNWNIYSDSTRDSYFKGALRLGSTAGPTIKTGAGSPEGVVAAPVGSMYTRTDGAAGTTLYIKESGTGNTGWKAK